MQTEWTPTGQICSIRAIKEQIILTDYAAAALLQLCLTLQHYELQPTLWTERPLSTGILQARILEQAAMPSSRGPSRRRDGTCISYVSCTGRQVPYH